MQNDALYINNIASLVHGNNRGTQYRYRQFAKKKMSNHHHAIKSKRQQGRIVSILAYCQLGTIKVFFIF